MTHITLKFIGEFWGRVGFGHADFNFEGGTVREFLPAVTQAYHVADLPLNPDGIGNMEPTLAFNTISSFTTNTNLQHYSGETGLSCLSQMIAITFLQFVTAATGVAACIAVIRGLGGNRLTQVGNFYLDLTRATVRVLRMTVLVRLTVIGVRETPPPHISTLG